MKKTKAKKKYPKLPRRRRELTSRYVGQEREAGRPRAQAVAIGYSREREHERKMRINDVVRKYL